MNTQTVNKIQTMNIKPLTPEQIDFIKKNRLKLSINTMAGYLGIRYNRVSLYMKKNNLTLTKAEKKAASLSPKKNLWIPEPWNASLNLVTMQRVTFKY